MNNHKRNRFAKEYRKTLYNTVSGKTITFLGWAFKKDTNDTRESAAIYVADQLMEDKPRLKSMIQKYRGPNAIDLNYLITRSETEKPNIKTETDPYKALNGVMP